MMESYWRLLEQFMHGYGLDYHDVVGALRDLALHESKVSDDDEESAKALRQLAMVLQSVLPATKPV